MRRRTHRFFPCIQQAPPDRQSVHEAKQALVSEYEADAYGYPDPEWTGTQPKGIQDLRWQSALLANMSMWMVMPSTVCLTRGFHALTVLGGRRLDTPIINHIDRERTLFCHVRDSHNAPTVNDLKKAGKLFETLSTVSRKNSVWPALRAFWAALTSYPGDIRYPLFWQLKDSPFLKTCWRSCGWAIRKRLRGYKRCWRERIIPLRESRPT